MRPGNADVQRQPTDQAHQGQAGKSPGPLENNIAANSGHMTSHPNILFVCVDVESFEFNHNFVTEIGVSTLSTQDLLGTDPGPKGKDWAAKIHSRHFRIKEHERRRNKVHVESCPEHFHFGKSEWISGQDAAVTMKSCFTTPPSSSPNHQAVHQDRKVVFVAHNAAADMKYLEDLGYDPTEDIVDILDTSDLANANGREVRQTSLSTLLLRHGIPAKHLHNAGNDAHYTLRLMIALAVDNYQHKRSKQEWDRETEKRIKAAGEEAKAKAEAKTAMDMEGWSTSENDDVPRSASVPIKERRQRAAGGFEPRGGRGGDGNRGGRGGRGGDKMAQNLVPARVSDHQSFPPLSSYTVTNTSATNSTLIFPTFQAQSRVGVNFSGITAEYVPTNYQAYPPPATFSATIIGTSTQQKPFLQGVENGRGRVNQGFVRGRESGRGEGRGRGRGAGRWEN